MLNKTSRGFTLVELLIVIIIIGILATMAVPQYQKMVERSKESQAYIKLDVLKKAQIIYYTEFEKWIDVNPVSSDFADKISALFLEPFDFSSDKYFQYWCGTGIYTTLDGKTHLSGVALAGRIDPNNNRTGDSLWLFYDDSSLWRAVLTPAGSLDHFEERVR